MRGTSLRTRKARTVTSSRLPIGVGTTYSRGTSSAGGPAHVPAAKHMDVQMRDRLLGVRSAVDDAAKAAFRNTLLLGNLGCRASRTSQERNILFIGVGVPGKVLPRNDEQMDRRLWI